VPEEDWTDHSTAATHEVRSQEEAGRAFNRSDVDLMAHFGLKPCTSQVGKPHENGEVESLNGVLKRRVEQ
jgi:transposase InsO family protein